MQRLSTKGFILLKGYLTRAAQEEMVAALRQVIAEAPLRRLVTPGGRPMSVRMSAAGMFGWHSDPQGYRYLPAQPDGAPWPAIPACVQAVWADVAAAPRAPECCLINHYDAGARMGLHQDRDEADLACPVVSISLGDPATFRMGGTARRDPTASVRLDSGDVVIMGGAARLAYHGIDRVHAGRSDLLRGGGRINVTLRVVT